MTSIRHLINAHRWDEALAHLTLSQPSQSTPPSKTSTTKSTTTTTTPSPLFSTFTSTNTSSHHSETPLSTACRVKAPAKIITALLSLDPDSTLHPTIGGKTPLHLACSDMRKTLTTTAASAGFFAEDLEIIRAIVSTRPATTRLADDDGWLPLHAACFSSCSLGILRVLIAAHPRSVLVANAGGVTPLDLLWDRCALNVEDGRCLLSPVAARFYDRVGGDDGIARVGEEVAACEYSSYTTPQAYSRRGVVMPRNNSAGVWAKVLLMVRAGYYHTVDDDGLLFRPLHALAGIECHPSLMEFALRVHADDGDGEAVLETPDEEGNLPLHVAVSRASMRDNEVIFVEKSSKGLVVDMLLRKYPGAARVRNKKGRIPLNLAIESGARWEDGVVESLFHAAPDLVSAKDGETQLYPFMLAGSVCSLNTCFQLLKCDPTAIGPLGS